MYEEGELFSETRDIFPNIIYLMVVQNLSYAYDLQKHLLYLTSKIYSERIQRIYDKEVTFLSGEEMDGLEKHENQFEEKYRNEIIGLIKNNEGDFSEFLINDI